MPSAKPAAPTAFEGTYGDYVLGKVGKVFPDLRREAELAAVIDSKSP